MTRSFEEGQARPLGFVAEVYRRDRALAWTNIIFDNGSGEPSRMVGVARVRRSRATLRVAHAGS
jgi:hypothetical protein